MRHKAGDRHATPSCWPPTSRCYLHQRRHVRCRSRPESHALAARSRGAAIVSTACAPPARRQRAVHHRGASLTRADARGCSRERRVLAARACASCRTAPATVCPGSPVPARSAGGRPFRGSSARAVQSPRSNPSPQPCPAAAANVRGGFRGGSDAASHTGMARPRSYGYGTANGAGDSGGIVRLACGERCLRPSTAPRAPTV